MSEYATLYVTSDERDGDPQTISGPERVQVEFGEDDGTRTCKHCGCEIDEYQQWTHTGNDKPECDPELVQMLDPDYDPEEDGTRVAEPTSRGAADICNSAALHFSDDEVRVTISVGDPRGAFAMTVRKTDDGKLILHVPYAGEPMPHMTLRKLHEGKYEIS